MGIIAVRYIFLPVLGILIVKGAVVAGFVQSHDIFFQFVLLLQYALPPAVSIGMQQTMSLIIILPLIINFIMLWITVIQYNKLCKL